MAGRGDSDVLAAIGRGEIDEIYCVYGAERFLVDRCLAALRTAVVGDKAGFNHDAFEVKESGLAAVLNAARTLPMFAKRRLVVGRGIDTLKADELEQLAPYVADPNPSTCLVLVGDKIDARLRAFQALKKAGYLHEFQRLKDRELASWVAREASARKLAMDSDAALALADAAGPDLGRLSQALEQLSLYTAGARVGRTDVEELIPETRERGVFELTKAIGQGDLPLALRLLANMLRNREAPLKIQFMLVRQIRQIWRAKELAATGASRQEIASAVGIAPFFLDDVLVPARRMSTAALARSLRRLYDADRALKSSRVDGDVQIARLVQQLATDAGRAAR